MAYISRMSDLVLGGIVADPSIVEGTLVTISTSGVTALNSLPAVRIAASGTVYPVFVAMAAPDNFPRPTNSLMYTSTYQQTIRSDVNTGWGNPVDSYTFYRQGLSTLENPVLTSGMLVQLHRGGTVTLTSGNWISTANIKVPGAKVAVADDGTGRFKYTTLQSEAIGFVQEYDGAKQYLTVVINQ